MKFILTVLLLSCISYSYAGESGVLEVPRKVIHVDHLEKMFAGLRKNPGWDMSKDMLWAYFFTHNELSSLEKAKKALIEKGYTFVDIYLSKKENPKDPDVYWLHVERIEVHTPASLDLRNNKLYIFADEFGLDSYDGMDVGPVTE